MKKASQTLVLLTAFTTIITACQPVEETPDTSDTGPCIPKTCEEVGWVCGTIEGGCNALVSCGNCDDGYKCKLGKCEKVCVPDCDGKCGGENGCGGLCPDKCSLTGRKCNNETGECTGACVARTCHSMGRECGDWDDWCDGTASCGACLPGSDCEDGICSAVSGEGLGIICESNAASCHEPFSVCLDLVTEAKFCSKTCTGDGQCGTGNCCVPVEDQSWCVPWDSPFLCSNPIGTEACFIGETCLPSPTGGCLFCFPEGEKTAGQECEGFNSCTKGLICHKAAGEKVSTCKEVCDPKNINACVKDNVERYCLADPDMGDFGVCTDGQLSCNPLQRAEDCPNTQNCVTSDAKCQVFGCSKAGTVGAGLACSKHEDCARGMYCADSTCRKLCGLTSQCGDNYECVAGCSSKVKYCMPKGGNECTPDAIASQCLAEQTCLPTDAGCATFTCVQPGDLTVGSSCETSSDCASGLMCYLNRCKSVCGLEKTCPQSGLCTFVCAFQDVGVCI